MGKSRRTVRQAPLASTGEDGRMSDLITGRPTCACGHYREADRPQCYSCDKIDRLLAERDVLKREVSRIQGNYEHLINTLRDNLITTLDTNAAMANTLKTAATREELAQ